MSYRAYFLILVLAIAANAQTARPDEDGRIRAKKPTVVTVEGQADPVETQREQPRRRSVGSIIGGGLKKTWNGLIDFTGWMLNVDDDRPSNNQQNERGRAEEKQPSDAKSR